MEKICFLKKETFLMTHRCYYCKETKRVGFVIAMEGGQAFSICQECGEEIISRLNLCEVSKSLWALPDAP
jgi:predicted RNA-binding Zn-ribbon protein involved in translation (DUF1610 family)